MCMLVWFSLAYIIVGVIGINAKVHNSAQATQMPNRSQLLRERHENPETSRLPGIFSTEDIG